MSFSDTYVLKKDIEVEGFTVILTKIRYKRSQFVAFSMKGGRKQNVWKRPRENIRKILTELVVNTKKKTSVFWADGETRKRIYEKTLKRMGVKFHVEDYTFVVGKKECPVCGQEVDVIPLCKQVYNGDNCDYCSTEEENEEEESW